MSFGLYIPWDGKVKFQAGMITVRDIVGIFAGLEPSIKPGRRIFMSFGSIPSIASQS